MGEVSVVERFSRVADEQLLACVGASDGPRAFGAFYRRHEDAMLLFFMRRTQNPETAADLTAEVFAAALESAHRFTAGKSPAVAWLYGIANHKLASSRRRGRVEDRARSRLRMEPLVLTDEALERVEALVDAELITQVLQRLLAELPADQHEAVRSRVVEERPYAENSARSHMLGGGHPPTRLPWPSDAAG
ncbi:MAG: sigma-70 family RNA polymerase sigma factor [Solirubrobacterales bacterium]|nr:sigma-70 family RNA polymerase sigma factor [Solirubrobacterales bacterium]